MIKTSDKTWGAYTLTTALDEERLSCAEFDAEVGELAARPAARRRQLRAAMLKHFPASLSPDVRSVFHTTTLNVYGGTQVSGRRAKHLGQKASVYKSGTPAFVHKLQFRCLGDSQRAPEDAAAPQPAPVWSNVPPNDAMQRRKSMGRVGTSPATEGAVSLGRTNHDW